MAVPLDAPMPADLDLGPGFVLRVTALDTTAGNVVSAVKVSNFSVLVKDTGAGTIGLLEVGPYMLVPGPNA